jgi:hypothetical protein
MRKPIFCVFALLFLFNVSFSQSTIFVEAPLFDNSTSGNRAPNGTSAHAYMRACALVLQSELASIPSGSTISSFGFTLNSGTTANACNGNISIYLENTSDVTYQKGTTWSNIPTGMTNVYASAMTIPVSATSTSIVVTLSTPFVYSGGGIYVAYDWAATGPYGTAAAIYRCNSGGLNPGCASAASGSSAPGTLGNTAFRPCFLFGIANTYTNEIQVIGIEAQGRIPAMFNTPHTINAIIKNASNITKTNIAVNLNVTGANPASNTQTISSLTAGNIATVSFPALNPAIPGLNTISVSVASDENNANNSATYAQSVTCNEWAINPAAGSYTSNAVGFGTGSGILANIYMNPVTSTLTGMRAALSTNTPAVGNNTWGVLLSSAGVVIATTNTITISSGMLGSFLNFTFNSPQPLVASTTYYLGFAQPVNSLAWYPAGAQNTAYLPANLYYSTGLNGGALNVIPQNFGYFGIEAIFSPTLTISAASQTVVCGSSATLIASTANNYTWSTGANSSSIVVSPTVTTGYSVTTTNTMGCVAKATPSVIISPIPVAVTPAGTVICRGDQVTLSGSGANSFTWTTSAGTVAAASIAESPTVNSVYLLTGSDPNGCSASAVASITVNPLPNVNAVASSTVVCLGNSVTLSASGASTYVWDSGATTASTGISPSVTAIYTVTGTSAAGCIKSATVGVTVNSFTPGITADTAICKGKGITLSATGGTAYIWNTGSPFSSLPVTPSVTSSYSVTGTGSNGCSGSALVTVTVNALPTISVTASRTLICKGEQAKLTAMGATSYSWSNSVTTATQNVSPPVNLLSPFHVTGTDSNNCSGTASISIKVNACSGLTDYNSEAGLRIYPNPVSGFLTVELNTESAPEILISNGLGQVVLTFNRTGQSTPVDVSALPAGIYFVKIMVPEGMRQARFVKN